KPSTWTPRLASGRGSSASLSTWRRGYPSSPHDGQTSFQNASATINTVQLEDSCSTNSGCDRSSHSVRTRTPANLRFARRRRLADPQQAPRAVPLQLAITRVRTDAKRVERLREETTSGRC